MIPPTVASSTVTFVKIQIVKNCISTKERKTHFEFENCDDVHQSNLSCLKTDLIYRGLIEGVRVITSDRAR